MMVSITFFPLLTLIFLVPKATSQTWFNTNLIANSISASDNLDPRSTVLIISITAFGSIVKSFAYFQRVLPGRLLCDVSSHANKALVKSKEQPLARNCERIKILWLKCCLSSDLYKAIKELNIGAKSAFAVHPSIHVSNRLLNWVAGSPTKYGAALLIMDAKCCLAAYRCESEHSSADLISNQFLCPPGLSETPRSIAICCAVLYRWPTEWEMWGFISISALTMESTRRSWFKCSCIFCLFGVGVGVFVEEPATEISDVDSSSLHIQWSLWLGLLQPPQSEHLFFLWSIHLPQLIFFFFPIWILFSVGKDCVLLLVGRLDIVNQSEFWSILQYNVCWGSYGCQMSIICFVYYYRS